MQYKLAIAFLLSLLSLSACINKPLQPVVLLYIEDGDAVEQQLRVIARQLAKKHDMYHKERANRPDEKVYDIFGATNNGTLYRLGLKQGSEPEFTVTLLVWGMIVAPLGSRPWPSDSAIVIISAPRPHPGVDTLISDWTAALDAAAIKYTRESRD